LNRSRARVVPVLAVHGGAGPRALTARQHTCLADALAHGYGRLTRGGAALDAVAAAIRVLEASGEFNAGAGARLQLDGMRRMDAAIMEGRGLRAGAVAAIERVRHPIDAARAVMTRTSHVLLVGRPAGDFAAYCGLERMPRRRETYTGPPAARDAGQARTLAVYRGMRRGRATGLETVGAVALDRRGSLAAGTSTGGIGCMLPGRVGDSPLIGSGLYADDESAAVSMTGLGESIIRIGIAKEITDRIAAGASEAAAVRAVLARLVKRIKGAAGALVLGRRGRLVIRHTTPHMAAAWRCGDRIVVADVFNRRTRSDD
jgi:L-asparaginase / beta-aspartyl-peptidase